MELHPQGTRDRRGHSQLTRRPRNIRPGDDPEPPDLWNVSASAKEAKALAAALAQEGGG